MLPTAEQEDRNVALDVEQIILNLTQSVSRIEATLTSHVKVEDNWREEQDRRWEQLQQDKKNATYYVYLPIVLALGGLIPWGCKLVGIIK